MSDVWPPLLLFTTVISLSTYYSPDCSQSWAQQSWKLVQFLNSSNLFLQTHTYLTKSALINRSQKHSSATEGRSINKQNIFLYEYKACVYLNGSHLHVNRSNINVKLFRLHRLFGFTYPRINACGKMTRREIGLITIIKKVLYPIFIINYKNIRYNLYRRCQKNKEKGKTKSLWIGNKKNSLTLRRQTSSHKNLQIRHGRGIKWPRVPFTPRRRDRNILMSIQNMQHKLNIAFAKFCKLGVPSVYP